MTVKANKYGITFGIIIAIMLYFLLCMNIFQSVVIDSDYSNLVLESADIIRGNIFLRNWNLTGISFLTTDLIFFVIGTLFHGISINAYYLAITLMFVVVSLISLMMMGEITKKNIFVVIILWLSIGAIPMGVIGHLRAHMAVWAYIFIVYYIADVIIQDNAKHKILCYSIFALCIALGVVGDAIMILAGVIPLIFVFTIQLLLNRTKLSLKNPVVLLCLFSILGLILGMALDKLYFVIGGANKNSFLESITFVPLERVVRNFWLLIEGLLELMDARFIGKSITTLRTPWYLLRASIVISSLIIIVYNVVMFFKRKSKDLVSILLSFGFIFITCFYIFTSASVDIGATRYFSYAPLLFGILLIRWLLASKFLDKYLFESKIKVRQLIAIIGILIIIFAVRDVTHMTKASSGREELVSFLESKNLSVGYTDFWNASVSTVTSKGKIGIRAIMGINNSIHPHYWFCKNSWYNEPANFVVIGNGYCHITEQSIKSAFGLPNERHEVKEYVVYVYNYDLSRHIVIRG